MRYILEGEKLLTNGLEVKGKEKVRIKDTP